jgi:phage N-6-adenine-methyltransferase
VPTFKGGDRVKKGFFSFHTVLNGGILNDILFSTGNPEWGTPTKIYQPIHEIMHFSLDVCATPANAKCNNFFTKYENGLWQSWNRNFCWMNPPYGKDIVNWMHKAFTESRSILCTVVCLVPVRTGTNWWYDYARRGEISYFKGRIQFEGMSDNGAPFDSALIFFDYSPEASILWQRAVTTQLKKEGIIIYDAKN